jgi:aminobenzoyl-glutamate transport protein
VDPDYRVDPTANWWLMAALVPVFTLGAPWSPRSSWSPAWANTPGAGGGGGRGPHREERKGLLAAALTVLGHPGHHRVVVDSGRRGAPGARGEIAPLLSSIVALMLFVFFLPGLVYGLVTGKIRSDKEVASMTSETMSSMGAYIVLAFVAAHFIAFFNWSNLGLIVAISGANGLQAVGFTGYP